MTPEEASSLLRSVETRAIEHTILLTRINRWVALIAVCAVLTVLLLFFRK
jgi:hypothetical protein